MEVWLIRLPPEQFEPSRFSELGEAACYSRCEESVWIKLWGPADVIRPKLMGLPGERWLESGDKLYRVGQRVPVRRAPQCDWVPPSKWFRIQLPKATVARRFNNSLRYPLRLARGGAEQLPWGLQTTLSELAGWTETAADAQIKPLSWATSAAHRQNKSDEPRCLVLGPVLPPVRGRYFFNIERVLVPAGFHWRPAVSVDVVRSVFGVPNQAWLLWEDDQRYTCIDATTFAPLSRASVRAAQMEV
ncbi:MAG TPA: hypothetical protein DDW52_08950 [Planctomycetaceae bacterium]|nr:hypothetical protein [Planctomycetaceae bacterium]